MVHTSLVTEEGEAPRRRYDGPQQHAGEGAGEGVGCSCDGKEGAAGVALPW